jgi:uncharacterized protein YkwD
VTIRIKLFLILVFIFFCSDAAFSQNKESSRLRIDASTEGSIVKLTVISPLKIRKHALLRIDRNDGSGFAPMVEIHEPKRKEEILDYSVLPGYHSYRAKLARKRKKSIFSRVEKLSVFATEDDSENLPELVPTPAPGSQDAAPPSPPDKINVCDYSNLPSGTALCPSGYTSAVLLIVNTQRALAGVGALSQNSFLDCSSHLHSLSMIAANSMTHDGWYETILQSGYKGIRAGQNIAYGYATAQEVMTGWMNSQGHRDNILRSGFKDTGISCLINNGVTWWTEDFGG